MSQLSGSRVLITGGAGFIGTHLAEKFCTNNKIVLFDNLRRDSLSELPELKNHPNVESIDGDALNKREVFKAMEGCNIVLHLAAIAGVTSYYNNPTETLRVNLIGTLNVLECCKALKVEKVVYFSTSEVYGADAFNVNEGSNHCIGPIHDFRWTYAVSKLASEQLTLRYGENHGFKAFTARPFNIYGPRQKGEGAISNFFRAVVGNKPIYIYGDGTAIRAWCYVSDCVNVIQKLLENNNIESGTFNIGNPRETYNTLVLAKLVCQVAQRNVPILFKQIDRTEIQVRVPNIEKVKRLLDFSPKVDLTEGLQLTYNWFRNKELK